jgi:hypothetical protein
MKNRTFYEIYAEKSQILNPDGRPSISTIFFDKTSIQNYIVELTGDKDGRYLNHQGNTITAKIPLAENNVQNVELKFQNFQQEKINQGFEAPTRWPRALVEEKEMAEARLEVLRDELKILQSWLKNELQKEAKIEDNNILTYGPRCVCSLHGLRDNPALRGVLKEIDNQKVSLLNDEILYINDPRSPYDGLAVVDYRRMAEEWSNERKAKRKEQLKKLQEEARLLGKPLPESLPWGFNVKIPRSSLPPFPSWAKNYKQKKEA